MSVRGECYYVVNVITWWMLLRDECYLRKASCALLLLRPNTDHLQQVQDSVNWIFTTWFQSLCRYLRWWTFNSPGYHPPSSQCFGNLLFLNNVFFLFFHPVGNLHLFWLSCLCHLGYLLQRLFSYFDFPIFYLRPVGIILKMHRAHLLVNLHYYEYQNE